MKVNEAPENIYIFENPILDFSKLSQRQSKDDIEYVRKDAFIEKAAEWLSKHAIKYYLCGSKFLGTDELVEDFKIAMKL